MRFSDEGIHEVAKSSSPYLAGVERCSSAAAAGRKRVAIIGASSSGLITAKELLECTQKNGDPMFEVQLFEGKGDVGGVYSSSAAYEGARLTASSTIMCFGCFSGEEETHPTHWPLGDYVKYLERFAKHFKLEDKILFNTNVKRVHEESTVDATGQRLISVAYQPKEVSVWKEDSEEKKDESVKMSADCFDLFHHVVVCTGITGGGLHAAPTPKWPAIGESSSKAPDSDPLSGFGGKIMHSSGLGPTGISELKGKRVLTVGLGESGSEIPFLACNAGAKKVCVQTRSGPGYVVPRRICGHAADIDTNRIYYSIPNWLWADKYLWRPLKLWLEDFHLDEKEDNPEVLKFCSKVNKGYSPGGPVSRYGTKTDGFAHAVINHGAIFKESAIIGHSSTPGEENSGRVHFADGTTFDCDVIIYCGGYNIKHIVKRPMDDEGEEDMKEDEMMSDMACDDMGGCKMGIKPRELYKRIVHPKMGLAVTFVGMLRPGFGAIPPLAEMQARLLAKWLSGEKSIPALEEMKATIKKAEARDIEQYGHDGMRIKSLGDFSQYMKDYAEHIGCAPKLAKLFFTDIKLWWRCMGAQLNGMQFRLHTPIHDDVRTRMMKQPMMPASVLLVELAVSGFCKVMYSLGFKSFAPGGLYK